ncbi:MAG: transketolase [Candidatus Methanofastidiosia archaeon]
MDTKKLEKICETIRINSLKMTTCANSGHPSSCLSCAEIIGVLLLDVMNINPCDPKKRDRDRFVISKGHAAPAYYSALSLKGFIPQDELLTLRAINTRLQGHPDMNKTPGVDFSTGSLGMGLSIANGMALAARLDNIKTNIYVLLGDGELQEGQIWESAMASSHYKLTNIVAIVDRNMLQCDGKTEDIMAIEPIGKKFEAFGWKVFEVDGHDTGQLQKIIRKARDVTDKPSVIIAHTIKGKGVECMAGISSWHGKPLTNELLSEAMKRWEK